MIPFSQTNMNVSGGTTRFLATVVIFACAVSGQFTFTGFPTAKKGSRHTVTCSYPGATSYKWGFRGETYNGAVYTFTVDSAKHQGVWECDAVVNGVTKTGKEYLLIYCDGVYATSATTTNPSIGDPIDLSCKVLSPSGNRVMWSLTVPGFDRNSIASVSNSGCEYYHTENGNIKFAPSTTCRPSTSNQFFNLIIKKVSTAHEGYWTCYDFGKSGCYSKPVRIAIAKPPKDPPTLTGFDNPLVGTNHSLTCDAWQLDVRPLTYTWYKDGVKITSGNTSTWRLQPVKKEANGRYRCEVVDNVKNLKAEAEDTLTVYYIALWNPAVEKKTEWHAIIGQSVNFTLRILAYPLPTSIELFKEIEKTSMNQPVNYTSSKVSDTTWILTIHSVQEEDYGHYIANVTNAAGSSTFSFNLRRLPVPSVPSNLKVVVTDSNDLVVTFKAGYNGGALQTFTIEFNAKERYPQVVRGIKYPLYTKTVTYTIRHLLPGTTYYIKVQAVNEVGGSKFTETANVTTAEITTRGNAVTAGEIAGAVVSVILFVILVAVVVVVMMQRMRVACFAGQSDTRAPVLDNVLTDSDGGEAGNISNKAFAGDETEPEYANQPPESRGATEPEYVNQPRQVRDSDAEVYEDVSTPNDTYAGLDMTARAVEDQPYESLKISEKSTYM